MLDFSPDPPSRTQSRKKYLSRAKILGDFFLVNKEVECYPNPLESLRKQFVPGQTLYLLAYQDVWLRGKTCAVCAGSAGSIPGRATTRIQGDAAHSNAQMT
jgi:hypothetical protein